MQAPDELDAAINYFKTSLSSIKNQCESQQKEIDTLFQQNKDIDNMVNKFSQYIDELLTENNDRDNYSDDDAKIDEDVGSFNMNQQEITFEGKTYKYNQELLYCGNKNITKAFDLLSEESSKVFPQGIKYCENLLNRQQKRNGSVIILINNMKKEAKVIYFFFNFKDIKDLSPSRASLFDAHNDLQEQLRLLNNDYSSDNYPQGIDYCNSILREQIKENGAVRIVIRSNGQVWTRYYFKAIHIKVFPNEKFFCFHDREKLEKQLAFIEKSKSLFYNGAEYCKKVIQDAIDNNSEVFIISTAKKEFFYYYSINEIEDACNAEWWRPSTQKNIQSELRYIDSRANSLYPQGTDYCKKIINKRKQDGKPIHFLVRNAVKDIWIYLDD